MSNDTKQQDVTPVYDVRKLESLMLDIPIPTQHAIKDFFNSIHFDYTTALTKLVAERDASLSHKFTGNGPGVVGSDICQICGVFYEYHQNLDELKRQRDDWKRQSSSWEQLTTQAEASLAEMTNKYNQAYSMFDSERGAHAHTYNSLITEKTALTASQKRVEDLEKHRKNITAMLLAAEKREDDVRNELEKQKRDEKSLLEDLKLGMITLNRGGA